jgi:hypothetical protein
MNETMQASPAPANPPLRRLVAMLALGALAACGSVPKRSFEFEVIDTNERPVPALIVIGDGWQEAADNGQYVNVTGDDSKVLEIAFPTKEITVTIAPVVVKDGKVERIPRTGAEAKTFSGYRDESRGLRASDHSRMLFILSKASGR